MDGKKINTTKTAATGRDASELHKFLLLGFLSIAIYTSMATSAYASTMMITPMGTVICWILAAIYGNLGRGLATLGVLTVGAGATLGKVTWGMAIMVGVGVSVIFNATPIVVAMTGNPLGTAICGGVWGLQ